MHLSTAIRDLDGTYGPRARLHEQGYLNKLAQHPEDGGLDLYGLAVVKCEQFLGRPPNLHAILQGSTVVQITVSTGIRLPPPAGSIGRIENRSSTPDKTFGATVFHSIMDAGYTGPWEIRFMTNQTDVHIVRTMIEAAISQEVALAQVVFLPRIGLTFEAWPTALIERAGRGDKGFGSTDLTGEGSDAKVVL